MVIFKFIYRKNIHEETYNDRDILVKDILKKYSSIIRTNINDLFFLYKGKDLSLYNNKNIFQFKKNKISIIVTNLTKKRFNKSERKNIICPICKKSALIKIKDDIINIRHSFGKANHSSNLSIEEFINYLFIDESILKCDLCQNEKYLYDKFYTCICGKIICPLCKLFHSEKDHLLIEYDRRNNFCFYHDLEYVSYCEKCKENLCFKCEEEHDKTHKNKIKILKSMLPNNKIIDEKKDIIKRFLKGNYEKKAYLLAIENYILTYNKIMEKNFNNYNLFYQFIFNYFDNKEKDINYESIKNLIKFKAKKLDKKLNVFVNSENNHKYDTIREFYKILRNELILTYKLNQNETKIRLFGKKFVENNKKNCYLIINNKITDLCEFYNINNEENNKQLTILYIEHKKSINLSYMFYDCKDLLSITVSFWDISEVTDVSYLFSGCISLKSLPDISMWNTSNITDISNLFSRLYEIKFLPDISQWDTSNVISMNNTFSHCFSLLSLPDISNWNTSKVRTMIGLFSGLKSLENNFCYTNSITDMTYQNKDNNKTNYFPDISKWNLSKVTELQNLFSECENLLRLPDISKWDLANVTNINGLFSGCKSLKYLPDISKWKISKVTNISNLFSGCNSLLSIPDISKWDIHKVTDLGFLFSGCDSLEYLPDISNWKINNVISIQFLFSGCYSLKEIPDISKWNTKNVKNMKGLFYFGDYYINELYKESCIQKLIKGANEELELTSLLAKINVTKIQLESLPDISNWNISNVEDISHMFSGCLFLKSLPDISKWNTINLKNISYLFSGCSSLTSLPDISNWNVKKIESISGLFSCPQPINQLIDEIDNSDFSFKVRGIFGCRELKSLPDISKWDIQNLNSLDNLFSGCISLNTLPDISKWKVNLNFEGTYNIPSMSNLFSECSSLLSIPDISKWNVSKVEFMNYLFRNCFALTTLPDLSKWDIKNVKEIKGLFYGCKSLQNIFDISKWNMKNLKNMDNIFEKCESLNEIPDLSGWKNKNDNGGTIIQ